MPLIKTDAAASIDALPNLLAAQKYTNEKLLEMRAVASSLQNKDILIGTFGSYARREASEQSDLDFFAICRTEKEICATKEALQEIAPQLVKLAGRPPSKDGAFGEVEDIESILRNIGGNDDRNQKITRRVLLLLEGEWLNNERFFADCRRQLLGRYIRPNITSHQLALFLLNDVIRYYRTMCVDFEFKTIENDKEWGTRNIKLVFSRKLLYFSGVLAVAETMQRSYEQKLNIIEDLLSSPVTERVIRVCGPQAIHALQLYDHFLEEIGQSNIRKELDAITEADRLKEPFRRLKDEGHHFSWRLMKLFHQTYDISHPIHRLIFL